MRKISLKQQSKNRELQRIKQELPRVCAICGMSGDDLAHLVPKSIYPEHYTNPKNVVILCRHCHNLYDNNLSFRQQQTHLLRQIQSFDELAANRYFRL